MFLLFNGQEPLVPGWSGDDNMQVCVPVKGGFAGFTAFCNELLPSRTDLVNSESTAFVWSYQFRVVNPRSTTGLIVSPAAGARRRAGNGADVAPSSIRSSQALQRAEKWENVCKEFHIWKIKLSGMYNNKTKSLKIEVYHKHISPSELVFIHSVPLTQQLKA